MSETKKRLVIIDGKSVFYRGYYAMPNLSTKEGIPTGGVYGFAMLSLEIIKKLNPDYVCVAWDKPKTNIRKRLEIYPEYKAGRKPAPPDFYVQIPLLHEYLKACNWPMYEIDDYEADDIMCSLAKKAEQKGIETIFITSDLDVLQCVSPLTHVYLLKKGLSNIEALDPEAFVNKYGIAPSQFIDLKALKGDSSDNIPGVPGIGEKTAIELLKKYGSLDFIYDNLDEIKPSTRQKLESGRDLAALSKNLVTLFDHAPISLDLDEMDITKLDAIQLQDLLKKFEFRSLIKQLPESMRVDAAAEQNIFTDKSDPLDIDKVVPFNEQKIGDEVIIYSRSRKAVGQDPEVLIISAQPGFVSVLDFSMNLKSHLTKLTKTKIIGHDVKKTLQIFIQLGLKAPAVAHDVKVAAFLINSLIRETDLTDLATSELGYEGQSFDLDTESLKLRAGEITAIIRAIKDKQVKKFGDLPKIKRLSQEIEWPVIPVLAHMEVTGIKLDSKYLIGMSADFQSKITGIEDRIYGYAKNKFNISSPQQLGSILFDELKLPTAGIKKGKTGYSTAADVLDKLRPEHPIIDAITEYRELTKLKNTYIDTLPNMVDESGRIHTSFNLTVAATGRLSSNDPNLQNIPVRTELGKSIRKAFVAEKGKVLISADYSQFELRLAAVMSNDTDMIEAFNNSQDIHVLTASQVFGVALEDVTKEMRYQAKAVNFGILYGQTPHGLAAGTGMSYDEARNFIDKYFDKRTALMDYIKSLKTKAYEDGYVETLFGRRRPTPDVHSSNFIIREAAYRQAVNMPIQGTEADLMKMAMIELDKKLPKSAHQLLQIHDSILVECDSGDKTEVEKILKEVMTNICPELGIRLEVDISSGLNWGDL